MTKHESWPSGDQLVLPVFESTEPASEVSSMPEVAPAPKQPIPITSGHVPEEEPHITPYEDLGGGYNVAWESSVRARSGMGVQSGPHGLRSVPIAQASHKLRPTGNVKFKEGSDSDHDPFWNSTEGPVNPATPTQREEHIKNAREQIRNVIRAKMINEGLTPEEVNNRMQAYDRTRSSGGSQHPHAS